MAKLIVATTQLCVAGGPQQSYSNGKIVFVIGLVRASNQRAAAEAEVFQQGNKRAKEKLHLVLKIQI